MGSRWGLNPGGVDRGADVVRVELLVSQPKAFLAARGDVQHPRGPDATDSALPGPRRGCETQPSGRPGPNQRPQYQQWGTIHRVPGQVGVNAHRSWFQVTAVSCVAGVLELFPQLEGNQMSSRRPGSRPVGCCSERLGGGGPRWRDPVCQWPGGVAVPLCPRRPTRPAHRDAGAGVCPVGPRGAPGGLLRTPGGRRPGLDGDEVIDQNRVVSPACLRGRQRTTPVPGERHLVPHWHRGRPSGHCGRAGHDQSQEVKPEARPNIISLDGNQTDFEETHRPLA